MTGLAWAIHQLGQCNPATCPHRGHPRNVVAFDVPGGGVLEVAAGILSLADQTAIAAQLATLDLLSPAQHDTLCLPAARLRIRKFRGLPDDGRATKAWSWSIVSHAGKILAHHTAATQPEALAVGWARLEEILAS